jgi:NAD(P)-dependent dehydrogenase (short-subunit alcohol dehydrogenase family)
MAPTILPVDMRGKRVVVSAGAAGIGAAMAKAFAECGAAVFVCDIDEQALAGSPYPGMKADMGDHQQVEAFMLAALKALGGLDILVNNAGIAGPTAPITGVTPKALEQTLHINLASQFHAVRLAVPALRAAGGGSIINISSVAGRMGLPNRTPYSATKWGIVGLTKSLAMELGSDNIRVNALLPGLVAGPRIERVMAARAEQLGITIQEETQRELAGVSLQCFVTADDIANMALFLASDFGARISGQAISVDGDLQTLPWR